jgi:hypothetical protein
MRDPAMRGTAMRGTAMRDTVMRGLMAPFKLFAMNIEPFNRSRRATYDAGVVLGNRRCRNLGMWPFFEIYPTVEGLQFSECKPRSLARPIIQGKHRAEQILTANWLPAFSPSPVKKISNLLLAFHGMPCHDGGDQLPPESLQSETSVDDSVDSSSTYPYSCPYYDPIQISVRQTQEILENGLNYGGSSWIDYLQVAEGSVQHGRVSIDATDKEARGYALESVLPNSTRIFFLQSGYGSKPYIALSKESFTSLLDDNAIPPSFLAALTSQSGLFTSCTTHAPGGFKASAFHFLIKVPLSPQIGGLLYFRHLFQSKSTTCIMSTPVRRDIQERLNEVYDRPGPNCHVSTEPVPLSDPFAVLAIWFHQHSLKLEEEMVILGEQVRRHEDRSGLALRLFKGAVPALPDEYAQLKRELHLTEIILIMFERTLEFQVELSEFLYSQHGRFREMLATEACSDSVSNSLQLSKLQACQRLLQIRGLGKRINVQVAVVAGALTANDANTTIRIAEDTRRDSNSMKVIAALTMIFLPLTSVATFFSMGFFHFDGESDQLRVSPSWRLYPAVTVPLTVTIFGIWMGWMKWNLVPAKRRQRLEPDHTSTINTNNRPWY